MSVYTHTRRGQKSGAVAEFPDLSLLGSRSRQSRATGTGGERIDAVQTLRGELTPKSRPTPCPDRQQRSVDGTRATEGVTGRQRG